MYVHNVHIQLAVVLMLHTWTRSWQPCLSGHHLKCAKRLKTVVKKHTSSNNFGLNRFRFALMFWQFLVLNAPLFQAFGLMNFNWLGTELSSTNIAIYSCWHARNSRGFRNYMSKRLKTLVYAWNRCLILPFWLFKEKNRENSKSNVNKFEYLQKS